MPALMFKFYRKSSNWTFEDGDTKLTAEGIDEITKEFSSCPLVGATVDLSAGNLSFQEINDTDGTSRGVFIMVYGSMTTAANQTRTFTQAFLLEKEGDKGYSLTNDCFRFLPLDPWAGSSSGNAKKSNTSSKAEVPTLKTAAAPTPIAAPTTPIAAPTKAAAAPGATKTAAPVAEKQAPSSNNNSASKSKKNKPSKGKKGANSNNNNGNNGNNNGNNNSSAPKKAEKSQPSKPSTWASLATTGIASANWSSQHLRPKPTGKKNSDNKERTESAQNSSGSSPNANNASGPKSDKKKNFKPGNPSDTLYVTGTDKDVTDKAVREVFAQFGNIKEVVLQQGYVFVVYQQGSSVANALTGIKDGKALTINNKPINVERKAEGKKNKKDWLPKKEWKAKQQAAKNGKGNNSGGRNGGNKGGNKGGFGGRNGKGNGNGNGNGGGKGDNKN